MDKQRILVVDDESGIRQLIKVFLQRYQFEIIEAGTGAQALEYLKGNAVDLIILDLMLPDAYGLDICKKIRQTSQVPIIMLTAVQGEMNTVLGFEAGADDYVEKPFSAHVLLSRIRAILKRTANQIIDDQEELADFHAPNRKAPTYSKAQFGQWTYLPEEACLNNLSGKHVFLTKNECLLLELFLNREQEILTREKIAQELNIDLDDPESRAIDVQISRLRNKLKDKTQNNLIKSIRNKGYLLSVPVRFIEQ
jgi:two-component system OmpR family response regulator